MTSLWWLQMSCDHCLVPRWHVWCVVTCWVHVLSGDHRCPRKSVLLRRNSNTSHMRLHLDSVCGAVCKMPASLNTGSLGRECERSCSIPRLPGGHFRLRVNMVIVWGEEREMREERRESGETSRDGVKITAAEDDCFCRILSHLSWFSS